MGTILDKIVAAKREELEDVKKKRPLPGLEKSIRDAPAVRDFSCRAAGRP